LSKEDHRTGNGSHQAIRWWSISTN